MIELSAKLLTVPIVGSLLLGCLPSRLANANAKVIRQLLPCLLGLQTAIAMILVVLVAIDGDVAKAVWQSGVSRIGICVDGLASLMLLMVSAVGLVVSRFSIRYLEGEAMQGRYFRWMSFTVGAVSLMVVSGNLLVFFVAWVMTSLGLHQLLLHYGHRQSAHRAAWTKFAISRIGDAFLISALVLTFQVFGTFDMATLFDQAAQLASTSNTSVSHAAIGWLIVLGAVTKSAQFPFHTWLPNTMETPTPVSALMHAGIVNAGGYLVIRMSPLIALSPNALMLLAAIGGFTACFAGIVMMTQPSIKRALAYSTIAQMGFMMLQCGLGAFSAAMLHILAHSFYKAHSFLSSGSVIAEHSISQPIPASTTRVEPSFIKLVTALILSVSAFLVVSLAIGFSIAEKPGGPLLAFILCLALTTWGWRLLLNGHKTSIFIAFFGTTALSLTYLCSYMAVNELVAPATPSIVLSQAMKWVSFDISIAFFASFLLSITLLQRARPEWLEPLRIHASNGFYVDTLGQRLFGTFAKS